MKCKSIKERIIISSNVLNVPFFFLSSSSYDSTHRSFGLSPERNSRRRFSCGSLGMLLDLEGKRFKGFRIQSEYDLFMHSEEPRSKIGIFPGHTAQFEFNGMRGHSAGWGVNRAKIPEK